MALNLTSLDAALKEIYTSDKVQDLVYKSNPFLAMVPKMTSFEGDALPIPLVYGNPQGRSATFATAQANKTNSYLKKFVLTRARDYSLADIDAETALASRSNSGSFLSAMTTEIDGAMNAITRSLATSLYRDGGGAIGQVNNSSFATTGVDLVLDSDAINFEVGMELVVDDGSGDGTGTLRSGTWTVTDVDRNATSNQITISANMSTGISAIAQNDYIFVEGDHAAKVKGLAAWLPASSSATSFFGVDRTADWTRLGGQYYDGSSDTIEDAILTACSYIAREGGRPDCAFISFERFNDLVTALGSKVQRDQVKTGKFGFAALQIHASTGTLNIIPDQNCQPNKVWIVQMDTWKLYSLGECPQILMQDGLRVMRNSSSDSYEVRIGYYANLGCRAPGFNGSVTVPTT